MQVTKAEAEGALRLIDQAVASLLATRQQHQQLQMAIMALASLVEAMDDGDNNG